MKLLKTILLLFILCFSLVIFTSDVEAGCSGYGGASCTAWDCLNQSCSQFQCNDTITSNMTCGSANSQQACYDAEASCPNGCTIGGCTWTEPGCLGGPACGSGEYCCAGCGGCVNTGGLTCNQYEANGCSSGGDGGGSDGSDGGSNYGCGGGPCTDSSQCQSGLSCFQGVCWGGSCDPGDGDGSPTPSPGGGPSPTPSPTPCATILGRVVVDIDRDGTADETGEYAIQTPGNSCGSSYYNWPNSSLKINYSGASNGTININTLNNSTPGCSPPYYAKNNLMSGNHTVSLAGLTNPYGSGDWVVTGVTSPNCTFNSGTQTANCNLSCGANQLSFSVAPNLNKICTVEVSDSTISQVEESTATLTGNSTGPIDEPAQLWLETALAVGAEMIPTALQIPGFADGTIIEEVTSNNGFTRYYYRYNWATCYTANGNECDSQVIMDGADIPEGDYYLHCDLAADPGRCTGNPNCTFENVGGLIDCSANGWVSCHAGPPPTDKTILRVSCQPQCSPACGQNDGCGGTCGTTNTGTPNPPTNVQPSGVQDMTSVSTVTATWTASTGNPPPSGYQVRVMMQGRNPNSVTCAVNPANSNQAYCQTVNSTTFSYNFTPDEQLTNELTIAVRAYNLACNAHGDTTTFSAWTTVDVDLVADITGTFYNKNATQTPNLCTASGGVSISDIVALETGTTIQASVGGNTYNGTLLNGNTTYHINNVPYAPSTWSSSSVTVDLDIYNSDPNNSYACNCPGNTSCSYTPGQVRVPPSPTPTYGPVNFFVTQYDFPTPWWQVYGGNVYVAENNLISPIPTGCLLDFTCIEFILARDFLASTVEQSAGVPMTGGGSIASQSGGEGNAGYITYRNPQPQVGQPNGGTDHSQVPIEDYDYFSREYDLSAVNQITGTNQNTKPNGPITESDGSKVYYKNGPLTVAPGNGQRWSVGATEKIVIFVNGDLTFSGAGDASNNNQFITVADGGYIAFIAAGDIIFDEAVGHTTLTNTTPIISGVFVASDVLAVRALTTSGVGDKRFIAEGTFVGWNGIELERDYDDGNLGALNNQTKPTEQFIFRPSYLDATPDQLKKPGLTWQEVNYATP